MDQSNQFPAFVTGRDSRFTNFEFSIHLFVLRSWFPIRNSHFAIRNQSRCSLALALDDCNLLRREVVEFIDKPVDLAVERGAFAFIEVLVALRSRNAAIL